MLVFGRRGTTFGLLAPDGAGEVFAALLPPAVRTEAGETLPLAAAALHLAFAQPMVWQIMQLFGIQNLTLFLGVTGAALLLFALLYCAMYRLTSNAYFRIVSTGGAAA